MQQAADTSGSLPLNCFGLMLQVKAELNYSDLLTVTDMVCSTAFDRDDEFFATAGVFRRVKIFDYASVQDSDTTIHYPVLEIPSR